MQLVILPGLDGSGLLYQKFAAALPQDWQVHCFSYPFMPLSYTELADWLEPQLPAQPFLLLGESFGGPLAYELTQRQPDKVLGLVLCCTFLQNPMPWASLLWHGLRKLEFTPKRRMMLLRYLLWGNDDPSLRAELEHVLALLPQPGFVHRVEQVLALQLPHTRLDPALPVLYLQAQQDKLVFKHCAVQLQQLLPQMQIQALNCSHFLLQQQPEAAARLLLQWCHNYGIKAAYPLEPSVKTTLYPDSASDTASPVQVSLAD